MLLARNISSTLLGARFHISLLVGLIEKKCALRQAEGEQKYQEEKKETLLFVDFKTTYPKKRKE